MKKILTFVYLVIILSACAKEETPGFTDSSLYVFGDSLSDVGNANISSAGLLPDKNYYKGRFSNGPLYIDKLASALGKSMKPSRSYGTNYALAGATSIAVAAQVFNFKENVFGVADPKAIYIVWSGANDIFKLLQKDRKDGDIAEVITFIRNAISSLSTMGAINLVVVNQVDMSKLPRIIQIEAEFTGTAMVAEEITIEFNQALTDMLDLLQTESNISTIQVDVRTLFNDIIADPIKFGFTNVSEACYSKDETTIELLGDETICNNSSEYLFWDGIHPTTAAHEILMKNILSKISAL